MRAVIFLFVLFLTGAAAAQAPQPGTSSQFIKTLGDEAIATLRAPGLPLEQREARFRSLLARGFDMDFIGRFVLGAHWRQATPDQQQDYLQAFKDYILDVYSARLGGYAGETLTVIGERPAGERDTMVNTRIDRPSGPPLEAQWRVRLQPAGLRIIDVMVAGVSMVATQRDEFAAVVQRQ
jgi:phospholipid transport system substrate-binding protein